MQFQNDWFRVRYLHLKKPHFLCDIKYSSDMISIYILISLKLLIRAVV